MGKIFKNDKPFYSRYSSQKERRQYLGELQKRVIKGYREAQDFGVLEKSVYYGEDMSRLQIKNYSHATKKQMHSEIERIERLLLDKKRSSAKWLSGHRGRDAHDLIKNYFDTHPDKNHNDFVDIYDVFDEIEAEANTEL